MIKNSLLRRILIICSLSALTSSAIAGDLDWTKAYENSTYTSYVDAKSIKNTGAITSYKMVLNFQEKLTPTSSVLVQREINCAESTIRSIKTITYSDRFGQGAMIGITTSQDLHASKNPFIPIERNEDMAERNVVCSKSLSSQNQSPPVPSTDTLESRSKKLFQEMENGDLSRAEQYSDDGESGKIKNDMINNWSHPKTVTDWEYLRRLDKAAFNLIQNNNDPSNDLCGADGGACRWLDPFTIAEENLRNSGQEPSTGSFPYLALQKKKPDPPSAMSDTQPNVAGISSTNPLAPPSTELSGNYNCWAAGEDKSTYRPEHYSFQENPQRAEWSMQGIGKILKNDGTYVINGSTLEITWSDSSGDWQRIEKYEFHIDQKSKNLTLIGIFNSKAPLGREKEYNITRECIRH